MKQHKKRRQKEILFLGLSLLVLFALGLKATRIQLHTAQASQDAANSQEADSQTNAAFAPIRVPQGLNPLDSPEIFGPENLYRKIDGQAELYLSAGMVRLTTQWFAETDNADSMFEVYIYHMGDGVNAFSVFSMQRRTDAQNTNLAPFAYKTENSLYLVHGPYYLEMIAAVTSERLLSKMALLAKNFIKDTIVDTKSIKGLGLFPKDNLDQSSIAMIAKNAFGYERLDRVLVATYTIGEERVTAYISKRTTSSEAKDLVLGVQKYFTAFGGKDIEPKVAIQGAKMVAIMGTLELVFSVDAYLAGIHEASTQEQAEKLGLLLAQTLRMQRDHSLK